MNRKDAWRREKGEIIRHRGHSAAEPQPKTISHREHRDHRATNRILIYPSPPSTGEGVKKLDFAPSPYPLPAGERVNNLKLIINFLPLDGGGTGWGRKWDFFTPSGRGEGEGECSEEKA
jgi:hypothetical protein